jgi:hypothetical protein
MAPAEEALVEEALAYGRRRLSRKEAAACSWEHSSFSAARI